MSEKPCLSGSTNGSRKEFASSYSFAVMSIAPKNAVVKLFAISSARGTITLSSPSKKPTNGAAKTFISVAIVVPIDVSRFAKCSSISPARWLMTVDQAPASATTMLLMLVNILLPLSANAPKIFVTPFAKACHDFVL